MKRLIKVCLILSIALFQSMQVLPQDEVKMPEVVPPAPNAASLGKYVEAPVSLATGIPSISVPIYTVSEGSINLPISLSYHAGGIKVEETASNVGLGWSLKAGGVITRSTRGMPDDEGKGYIHTTKTVENLRSLTWYGAYEGTRYYEIVNMMLYADKDYEPDVFNFNFAGYSGRLYYDQKERKFIQIPFGNLKIQEIYDLGIIIAWEITAPDGIKYYFGKSKDGTRKAIDKNSGSVSYSYGKNGLTIGSPDDIPEHIGSWYLLDIVSPTGQQVKFKYTKHIGVTQFIRNQESTLWDNCQADKYSASFSLIYNDESVLENIEFTNGKVEFICEPINRLDLTGSKALQRVNIYNKDGQLWKGYKLEHDYFISQPETGSWRFLEDAEQRRYRLKLLSVQEEDALGNTLPSYTFEYNPIQLPSRFSNAQDYWGYYNGIDNNQSLIPFTEINNTGIYLGDADRSIDIEASQACMLTKIYYPTGGSAEYIYESNNALTSNVIYKGGKCPLNRLDIQGMDFEKIEPNVENEMVYSKEFLLPYNTKSRLHLNTSVSGCILSGNSNLDCHYNIELIGVTDPSIAIQINNQETDVKLMPGEYKIKATKQFGSEVNPLETDFDIELSWGIDPYMDEDAGKSITIIGGQRVNKTILKDNMGKSIEKNYNYNLFYNGLTSGYTISAPLFSDPQFFNGTCNPSLETHKVTSFSQAPLAFVNGNTLGYSNVTEYIKNTFKTEHSFSMLGDLAHFNQELFGFVVLPDVEAGWLRGNLTKKEIFKLEGGIYKTIQKVENEYETADRYIMEDFGVKVLPTIGSGGVYTFKYGIYSAMSEWHRLKSTKTTDYFEGKELVQSEEYFYENNPLLASCIKTTNNSGDTIIKRMYYPDDLNNSTALGEDEPIIGEKFNAIDRLKSNNEHRIAEPIQVSISKKEGNGEEQLLSRQRTYYKEFVVNQVPESLILPSEVKASKGNNPLETKVTYHAYNDRGKPLEISSLEGVHYSYLWAYNKTLPVAKIDGESYSSVENYLLPTKVSDLQGMDNESLEGELNKVRGLSNGMVSSFTYNPLVGKLTQTEPNGKTTYYNYDNFGRLTDIKDFNKKILEKYEYNYQRPGVPFVAPSGISISTGITVINPQGPYELYNVERWVQANIVIENSDLCERFYNINISLDGVTEPQSYEGYIAANSSTELIARWDALPKGAAEIRGIDVIGDVNLSDEAGMPEIAPSYELISSPVPTASIIPTGRQVNISLNAENTGNDKGLLQVSFSMDGATSQNGELQLIPGQFGTISQSLSMGKGYAQSISINFTGGLEGLATVNIPASPAEMVFSSYNLTEGIAGAVNTTVTYANNGYTEGDVQVSHIVYRSESNQLIDPDNISSGWGYIETKNAQVTSAAQSTGSAMTNFTFTENGTYAFILKRGSVLENVQYIEVTNVEPPAPTETLELTFGPGSFGNIMAYISFTTNQSYANPKAILEWDDSQGGSGVTGGAILGTNPCNLVYNATTGKYEGSIQVMPPPDNGTYYMEVGAMNGSTSLGITAQGSFTVPQ